MLLNTCKDKNTLKPKARFNTTNQMSIQPQDSNLPSKISLLLYGSTPSLFNNDHLQKQPVHFGKTDKSSLFIFMDLKVCRQLIQTYLTTAVLVPHTVGQCCKVDINHFLLRGWRKACQLFVHSPTVHIFITKAVHNVLTFIKMVMLFSPKSL